MHAAFILGPHYLTKAALPSMKQNKFGRIIHITSEVFELGLPRFSAYVAAKGGQIGYMRSTANELAPHGITVNALAPGWIPVERHDDVPQETRENYLATIPVGRWGTPQDIAHTALFFRPPGLRFCHRPIHLRQWWQNQRLKKKTQRPAAHKPVLAITG